MPLRGEYEPSPWEPIAKQVELYERTGGVEGGLLEGQPCIILTSRGAKTGKLRKTPLIRVESSGSYAVLASMGGAPSHPNWYHNLVANPEVTLQDGSKILDLRAHEATGDERDAWWARATEVWPAYDDYQAATERVIPLFVLNPI